MFFFLTLKNIVSLTKISTVRKTLKLTIISLFLITCSGRDEEKTGSPIIDQPSNNYTQIDAVGKWKVTFFDNPNNNLGWEVENNDRNITFNTNGKFTSFNLTESIVVEIGGDYVIDSKGLITTTNLNLSERQLTMFLSDKKNAIITISTKPGSNTMRKYKVVKL